MRTRNMVRLGEGVEDEENLEDFDSKKRVLGKIEKLLETITDDIMSGRSPYFQSFDFQPDGSRKVKKIELYNKKSQLRFTILFHLLCKCYQLVSTGQRQTKRDIFYDDMKLFGRSQSRVDRAIYELSMILDEPRWELNIDATAKGLIAGNLSYKVIDGSDVVLKNNHPHGHLITNTQNEFYDFSSDARFILVVEKEAIYRKILRENCFQVLGSFILITGKGYPDFSTRLLLNSLMHALKIPIFGLFDADAHGMNIALQYKAGNNWTYLDLKVPTMKLIGLLPSEITALSTLSSAEQILNLTPSDVKILIKMQKKCKDELLKREIEYLLTTRKKAELEILTNSSHNFLTSIYLKTKIKNAMATFNPPK